MRAHERPAAPGSCPTMRLTIGYGVMSSPKRAAANTCGTRQHSAMPGAEPAANAPVSALLGQLPFDIGEVDRQPMPHPRALGLIVETVPYARRCCSTRRFISGWPSEAMYSAMPRTQARSSGSTGSSGCTGNTSSRYSRIARLWPMALPSCTRVGTSDCGLIRRYASACCWPPSSSRCTGSMA